MKRKDLIRLLESNGWWLLRNGANHDIYTNGQGWSRFHAMEKSKSSWQNPSSAGRA